MSPALGGGSGQRPLFGAGTSDPLVTIVTPSYNQGRFIRATIESVLAQTYPKVEYLVIDGGSTDDTISILEGYEDRLTWVSEPDRGQAHAINKGFQRAEGEILAWLNSDDLLVPEAAALAVLEFARRADAGFVYGDAYATDEDGYLEALITAPEPNPWRLANVVDYVTQPAAFFRRSTVAEVGWLDESWHWLMDWDLFMRLSLGFGSAHIPAVMAYARIHDTAKTSSGGAARFVEIDRFIRNYSERRFPTAFWRYTVETVLQVAGARFRQTTAALGLDPAVPSMVLRALQDPPERGPSYTAPSSRLHTRLERRSALKPLSLLGWLLAHPVRSLRPDSRPLRRRQEVRRMRTTTVWGEELTVALPDPTSQSVLRLGYFEPEVSSFLIRHLRAGMSVLDVGAHIGYFSLLAAACVGAGGEVHAFEANPRTAQLLRWNVARRPQLRVVEAAVWSDGAGIELNDYGEAFSAHSSVRDTRLPALSGANRTRVAVASLTLDSYCSEATLRPDLVKIDAAGAEHEILAGMSALIKEVRPALVVRVGDLRGPEVSPSHDLIKHLIACGYTAFDPLVGSLRRHEIREHYPLADVVFLP